MLIISNKFNRVEKFNTRSPKMGSEILRCPRPLSPYENGRTIKTASPADILNAGNVDFLRPVDPASLPLGNGWHGPRPRDRGYRGPQSSGEEVF